VSCLYCYSCNQLVDTDDAPDGCKSCQDKGMLWCWGCGRGYEPLACPKIRDEHTHHIVGALCPEGHAYPGTVKQDLEDLGWT